jgi:hypothetical protein
VDILDYSLVSPFFNPENPAPRHLKLVPKWAWRFTCRCVGTPHDPVSWVMDNSRNMYVCSRCRLPSGFVVMLSSEITGECDGCGNDYVVWRRYFDRTGYSRCLACGGSNAAALGQKTQDEINTPFIEEEL